LPSDCPAEGGSDLGYPVNLDPDPVFPLPEPPVLNQNSDYSSGRSFFGYRGLLVPVSSRLQYEHRLWVGLIALLGVDAETGVFMLLYLDLAYEQAKKRAQKTNRS
jgi:hypothetical protein